MLIADILHLNLILFSKVFFCDDFQHLTLILKGVA